MGGVDRHFEYLIEFQLCHYEDVKRKYCITSVHERVLLKFSEAAKKRPSLQLRLLGCVNEGEPQSVTRKRLKSVQQWFARHGITSMGEIATQLTSSRCPTGVICQLFLDGDAPLRAYFLDSSTSSEFNPDSFAPDTRETAELLERHFMTCMH